MSLGTAMFKRSRRKIVATIMFVLVLLWVATLGIIYIFSYFEMSNQNKRMLKAHAGMYVLDMSKNEIPSGVPAPNGRSPGIEQGFADSPMFRLSTFYTVAFSYDGKILETKNEPPTVHTDDDLEMLARKIIEEGRESGTKNNLAFYKTDKGGYILVTFMDNTVINESAATLLRYTLIFGGFAMVVFFLFSVFIARKIVRPLEVSYQKQKQFISDAGHELKTPVSIVGANAELLSREIGNNQWLANIQYENERMGLLVSQLLELARTENIVPKMEHIDFSYLVNGETLPFESIAFEKGIVLHSNITGGISVVGSGDQLKQLVSILLDNAIRHSSGGNEVCLNLTRKQGAAILSVVNKGEEIPKEQHERIFERFYRADTARNSEDKHYGLGLAIAKAIVDSHKGHIEVFCDSGLVEFRIQIPSPKN